MSRGLAVKDQSEPLVPGKLVALGRNYRAHAREMGSSGEEPPLLFLKPASALVADGGQVVRPAYSLSLQPEVELVVAIGRGGRRIPVGDAPDHVFGYAVGLDMTLRDVQTAAKRRGHPWTVAKGFDTAAPLSMIVPAAEAGDPSALTIELLVNGELRQHGRVTDMILSVPEIIAFVSRIFTLEPGDLIFTGTPEGVADVFPGDDLRARLLPPATELEVTVISEEDGAP